MSVGEFCNREVVIAQRNTSILELAQLLRQHHVGGIVIGEERSSLAKVAFRGMAKEKQIQQFQPYSCFLPPIRVRQKASGNQ
ncbi:MAG: CBS domain-containing protein [Desulfovibrionaceae bacterium]|nr:CBS domain-containing protein [Desulfovibrionaceae bacterium]